MTRIGDPSRNAPPHDRSEPPNPPLVFTLPWPPSMNHYWRTVRRPGRGGQVYLATLLSDAAVRFRTESIVEIVNQRIPRRRLAGSIEVGIRLHEPGQLERARDVDNLLKPTLDALTHAGVIADDRHIDRLVVERWEPEAEGHVELVVAPWTRAAGAVCLLCGHPRARE